ncbi:MauE/DoxX family redox-associated membrane protein [Streptomyces longwoodensis]|uniref:MauE/DoxX family redox-associated membrane protein n=1 Tax=Streptomyces longwoodensis TaxID=68231 RepID=UPI003408236F
MLSIVLAGITLCLAGLLAASVKHKVTNAHGLAQHIQGSGFIGRLPNSAALSIVAIAAAAEAAIALLLVTRFRSWALLCCILLFATYTLYIFWLIRHKPGESCRCFRESSKPVSPVLVVRNLILIGITAFGWAVGSRELMVSDYAIAATPAGTAVFVTLYLDEIADFFTLRPSH